MHKILFAVLISCTISCLSLQHFTNDTIIEKEDSYVKITNTRAHLSSLTFGDFRFATNTKDFKKLNNGAKPPFKHIIYYAKTTDPNYDYYVLYNTACKKYDSSNYNRIDTTINGKNLVLLFSNHTPEDDKIFILKNISIE